jgi:hypothetical protein
MQFATLQFLLVKASQKRERQKSHHRLNYESTGSKPGLYKLQTLSLVHGAILLKKFAEIFGSIRFI